MLFNPQWNQKPNPHSLDDLIAWLETKHPEQHYDFSNVDKCLIAQWVKHCDGRARPSLSQRSSWYIVNGVAQDFRPLFRIVSPEGHTFGDALKRAKSVRQQEKKYAEAISHLA